MVSNENCKTNHGDGVKQTKSFWKTVGSFMSDTGEVKDKIKLTESDNVIANTKDVCNVFNEYFITIAKDMNELHHIDFDGPLDNILSAYQNHPSDIQ